MRRRTIRNRAAGLILASAAILAGCSGNGAGHGADAQLRFGVRMAQQGLWSEALFRFERARSLAPGSAKVLNNLAVAQEAAGRYDEALATYQEALRISPGDRDLRQNYARFVDFYQSFRPTGEAAESGEPAAGEAEAAEAAGETAASEEPEGPP